jgi:hypothetical protein
MRSNLCFPTISALNLNTLVVLTGIFMGRTVLAFPCSRKLTVLSSGNLWDFDQEFVLSQFR